MTITKITQEEYDILLKIYQDHPNLFLQNNGYEYIRKDKFSEDDTKAWDTVTAILQKNIKGFSEFSNFRKSKSKKASKLDGEPQLRFQYNWTADDDSNPRGFTGVGYLLLIELLKGFIEFSIGEEVTVDRYNHKNDMVKTKVLGYGEAYADQISYKFHIGNADIECTGKSIIQSNDYELVPDGDRHDKNKHL